MNLYLLSVPLWFRSLDNLVLFLTMNFVFEFTLDYGDKELYDKAQEIINAEVENIQREDIKNMTKASLEKMKNGERDFYL